MRISPFLALLALGCHSGNMVAPGGLEAEGPLPNVPDLVGVYDLTAQITTFDPAWGEDLQGYQYAAVMTIQKQQDATQIGGSYADLRLMGPGGDSEFLTATGLVTGSIDRRGRLVIELLGNGGRIGLTLVVATVDQAVIGGGFGCCGHISGTFSAERK